MSWLRGLFAGGDPSIFRDKESATDTHRLQTVNNVGSDTHQPPSAAHTTRSRGMAAETTAKALRETAKDTTTDTTTNMAKDVAEDTAKDIEEVKPEDTTGGTPNDTTTAMKEMAHDWPTEASHNMQRAPPSLSHPASSPPITLDAQAFPHILERVIDLTPLNQLIPLRQVSQHIRAQVDAQLCSHLIIRAHLLYVVSKGLSSSLDVPRLGWRTSPKSFPFQALHSTSMRTTKHLAPSGYSSRWSCSSSAEGGIFVDIQG